VHLLELCFCMISHCLWYVLQVRRLSRHASGKTDKAGTASYDAS